MAYSAQYRCYFLNAGGSVSTAETIDCNGDEAAVAKALGMWELRPHHHGIELWSGGRRLHFEVRLPELAAVPIRESARRRT